MKNKKKKISSTQKSATVIPVFAVPRKETALQILGRKTLSLLRRLKNLKLHVKASSNSTAHVANYYTIGFRQHYEIISLRSILYSLFRFKYWLNLIRKHEWVVYLVSYQKNIAYILNLLCLKLKDKNFIFSFNWTPGTISNKAQIIRTQGKKRANQNGEDADFVLLMDSNDVVMREANLENIPIIGFLGDSNTLQTFFISLFGDNRNLGILKFYSSLLELYRKKINLNKSFVQLRKYRVIRRRYRRSKQWWDELIWYDF